MSDILSLVGGLIMFCATFSRNRILCKVLYIYHIVLPYFINNGYDKKYCSIYTLTIYISTKLSYAELFSSRLHHKLVSGSRTFSLFIRNAMHVFCCIGRCNILFVDAPRIYILVKLLYYQQFLGICSQGRELLNFPQV